MADSECSCERLLGDPAAAVAGTRVPPIQLELLAKSEGTDGALAIAEATLFGGIGVVRGAPLGIFHGAAAELNCGVAGGVLGPLRLPGVLVHFVPGHARG